MLIRWLPAATSSSRSRLGGHILVWSRFGGLHFSRRSFFFSLRALTRCRPTPGRRAASPTWLTVWRHPLLGFWGGGAEADVPEMLTADSGGGGEGA